MRKVRHSVLSLIVATAAIASSAIAAEDADLVVTNARIYTADNGHHLAEALAVRDGRIIYVGMTAESAALIGPHTQHIDAGGKLLLPGLVDAHIHPLGIVQFDTCDLKSEPMSLAQISSFVRACIERYKPASGEWLLVDAWSFGGGNAPNAQFPTARRNAWSRCSIAAASSRFRVPRHRKIISLCMTCSLRAEN